MKKILSLFILVSFILSSCNTETEIKAQIGGPSSQDIATFEKQIEIIDSKSKNDEIHKNENSDEDSIETKMDSLKSMLDKELITEDEYNEKKKNLLEKL